MEKTTLLLCVYCAIIGTGLWLSLFLALKAIIFRMENRYNLSVPFVVVDKVGKNSRCSSKARVQDGSKDNATFMFNQEKQNIKTQNYEKY